MKRREDKLSLIALTSEEKEEKERERARNMRAADEKVGSFLSPWRTFLLFFFPLSAVAAGRYLKMSYEL